MMTYREPVCDADAASAAGTRRASLEAPVLQEAIVIDANHLSPARMVKRRSHRE
jgi:hypothetical protein